MRHGRKPDPSTAPAAPAEPAATPYARAPASGRVRRSDGHAPGPFTYVFAHEVGHLLGLRHDPDTDSHVTPYAYGHGCRHPTGAWRTVMAYHDDDACGEAGCPVIPYYSNPDADFDGDPTGTSTESDNARVLEERICDVAAFREGVWM